MTKAAKLKKRLDSLEEKPTLCPRCREIEQMTEEEIDARLDWLLRVIKAGYEKDDQ